MRGLHALGHALAISGSMTWEILWALILGFALSAVVQAAVLLRKGAGFTAAMAFEIASTNLVVELGIILALLIGWQFTLAGFIGGSIGNVPLAD